MTNTDTNHDLAFDIDDEDELREIHEFDFARVAMLMTIAEKVATVMPKATSLLGIAQAEVEHMNAQAKDIAMRRAEKARQMEQRRYEAEQARLKDEADREAAEQAADDGRPKPRGARAIPANPQPAPMPEGGEPSPARRL